MSIQDLFDAHQAKIHYAWVALLGSHADYADLGREALLSLTTELMEQVSESGTLVSEDRLRARAHRFARRASALDLSTKQAAGLILLLKQPMVEVVREMAPDVDMLWELLEFVDRLGLEVMGLRIEALAQVTELQRLEVMELSTPVVRLWDGIVLMPLIGTLDSERSAAVLETLLQGIEDADAEVAILDISGVPTIDAEVAQRLLRASSAVRLMGAELYISGVGPRIAQTIVTLGLDLSSVRTTSSLAKGLKQALERRGLVVRAS
ncbi:MAG: rsbT co-antagonist protein RsbR [Cognaticolwellia sp.]|jgi:rsbT co-antagonist protein RsbR